MKILQVLHTSKVSKVNIVMNHDQTAILVEILAWLAAMSRPLEDCLCTEYPVDDVVRKDGGHSAMFPICKYKMKRQKLLMTSFFIMRTLKRSFLLHFN